MYCYDCKWQQDDFYSVTGYNPANFLKIYTEDLCGPNLDVVLKGGTIPITLREQIARHYEAFASRIRTMKWVTLDAFKNDPNKVCPICGSANLHTD